MNMAKDNDLKEVDTKNRTCYYYDKIMDVNGLVFDKIRLDKKLEKNFRKNDRAKYPALFPSD